MKHIHEKKNLYKKWKEVSVLLRKILDEDSGQDHIKMVLYYTLKKIPEEDKMELENFLKSAFSDKAGEKVKPSICCKYTKNYKKLQTIVTIYYLSQKKRKNENNNSSN